MTEPVTILPQPVTPAASRPNRTGNSKTDADGRAFEQVLSGQLDNSRVDFSRHARQRLSHRGIELTAEDIERLGNAVDKLRSKGGRDSLVLLDHTALVVSVKNRQVVTVLDQQNLKDNVFTHIDSAIII